MGFPTSRQPRSCITANFPKKGFRYPNLSFFAQIAMKKHYKVCYRVSLSKNFQQHTCSEIIYLLISINILAGVDPIPVKFGRKGTDPQ